MKNKLVSIILPVYNGEIFLKNSIESCLKQTYKNIELIIVNDASTDKSGFIAETYAAIHSNIKVLHNPVNKKLPASLNIGLSHATGEYLTWTSDDNLYDTNAIEELITNLHEHDIIYSNYRKIDVNSKHITDINLPSIENLYLTNCIGACFLFKKDIFNLLKGYNETLFLIEDYDFWIRAYQKNMKFKQLSNILYSFRVHDNSLSTSRRMDVINIESKYFSDLFKIEDIALFFHFRGNILIKPFLLETIIELANSWDLLIKTLLNIYYCKSLVITQCLLNRTKNHLIIIYIIKKYILDFKLKAHKDFIQFYTNYLPDIEIETSENKKIEISFQKYKFDITNKEDLSKLLDLLYKI